MVLKITFTPDFQGGRIHAGAAIRHLTGGPTNVILEAVRTVEKEKYREPGRLLDGSILVSVDPEHVVRTLLSPEWRKLPGMYVDYTPSTPKVFDLHPAEE